MKQYLVTLFLFPTLASAMAPSEKDIEKYEPIIEFKETIESIQAQFPLLFNPDTLEKLKKINQKKFFSFAVSKLNNQTTIEALFEKLTAQEAHTDINEASDLMPHNTLLHCAAQTGNEPVLELLLQNQADVAKTNMWGYTPLHSAVIYNKNVSIVQALINAKAPINEIDRYRQTPLHHAVRVNNIPAIELLLSLGADTTIRDGYGRNAKEYAEKLGDPEIIALFEKRPKKRLKLG